MSSRRILGFWILAALQTACASKTIIRDRDYKPAHDAYQLTDPASALEKFPGGESGGFITSVEKGWLSQWAGRWDPRPMQKQVATFDERRFVSITREAGVFLFQESEEGYVPSEHEIVILHLVSATHFFKKDQPEEAKVELRRAGYVLDRFWDDPALRLWLGALWTSLGEWNEAQVDFRRAAELTNDPDLRRLSERPRPPPNLVLHFYGNGPLLIWKDGEYVPRFAPENSRHVGPIAAQPTAQWFQRHTLRNSELRETLVKSNFMAQYLGGKTATYAEYGIVKTTAMTLRAIGVAVGIAIVAAGIYVLAHTNSTTGAGTEWIGAAALGAGGAFWGAGQDLDTDLSRQIKKDDRKKQEDLRIYRLLRFMPAWIALDLAAYKDSPNALAVPLGRGVVLANHF